MGKLDIIRKGKCNLPPRIVIYGLEGIGKTTLASKADKPIFIPTEDGIGEIDCDSFPMATSYEDVIDDLKMLCQEDHDYKTVVIDSADWLEPLAIKSVLKDYGTDNLNTVAGGYGRGYEKYVDKWAVITSALNWLRTTKSMGSIIIAHSKIKTFNDPENPAYDKYQLKLNDRACNFLMEWADAVLFATRKVLAGSDNDKRMRAQYIGERILRTTAGPACCAKNRFGMPDELPMEWNAIAKAIADSRNNNNKENNNG